MRGLVALLFLVAVSPAFSWAGCEDELTAYKPHFEQIVSELQSMGMSSLLSSYTQGLVQVQFSRPHLPWQNDLFWSTGHFGTRVLTIRRLDWKNEREHQIAIWRVAEVFYRLELSKRLWSARTMSPVQPAERSQDFVARVSVLQEDMYRLLDQLPLVAAEDVLPERDPGRHWRLMLTVLRDSSPHIFPNQRDLRVRAHGGTVADILDLRYGRSTLVHAYLDWLKRAVIVGGVSAAAALGAPPAVRTVNRVTSGFWAEPVEQSLLTPAQRKTMLERQIQDEEDKVVNPDPAKIERLKQEYRDLLEGTGEGR